MAKKQFKAQSKRLLDLMINSIYTNKDIFLRELISNASDACDKLRYISLTDEKARGFIKELSIEIIPDFDSRTIKISDNGIGMTEKELEENLGTICKSGSLSFKEEMTEKEEKEALNIIGQFGVGFYSAFMVADKVTVKSRSFKEETAHIWESDGADGYTVKECEKDAVGTEIILTLKEDSGEDNYSQYLTLYKLKELVKTYSDYIPYPIRLPVEKRRTEGEGETAKTVTYTEIEAVNSMVPLWKKSKAESKKEDTDRFYKDSFYDFEEPLFTISVSAEGIVSYKALLFIPRKAPHDYFTKDYEKGLKLYNSGVLIMDKCSPLLEEHFRFVKGVVDSEDLSLNISREMLQQDANLNTIAKNINKKIHSELKKALEKDREKYELFFSSFGIQLKYGCVADYGINKDTLKDLLLFYSSKQERLITLDEYIKNMGEDQKHIYYACGSTVQNINSLPQAELVKAKGYDMLCLTDEVDQFLVNVLREEQGKDFRSINGEDNDLLDKEKAEEHKKIAEENTEMLSFIKECLGIDEVIVSTKLKSHAVCLSAKGNITLEMEKYFSSLPLEESGKVKAQRVLELNSDHPVFEKLKNSFKEDREKCKTISEVLYGQALLIAGLPIENPSDYAEKLCSII